MNCATSSEPEALRSPAIRHFAGHFQRVSTLEEAGQSLAEASEALGWNLAAFHSDIRDTTMPRARNGDYIANVMGWPKDYLDRWAERRMGPVCPVGRRSLAIGRPFFWHCDPDNAVWQGHEITLEQHHVLDYYGLLVSGGLAVPVRRDDGKTGYVSWNARGVRLERQHSEAALSAAITLSHAFIRHVAHLTPSQPATTEALSERERECLAWAARGKTEQEIAGILHRSAATIHFHLRNAITKLNACNRTHAVAIACTRGLIYAE